MKLLIIDDDETIHLTYKKPLNQEGFKVLNAYDGQEGLDLAFEHKPDLIILDLTMPGMGGQEVCKRLKDSPKTSDIKIIMLTGKNEMDDRQSGLESGADEYLPKPYPASFLIASVKKQLCLHPYDKEDCT